jgi:hypothetical protein
MQLIKLCGFAHPCVPPPFAFYAAFAAGRSVIGFEHAESFFRGNENNKAQQSTVDHQNDPTIFVPTFLIFRPTFSGVLNAILLLAAKIVGRCPMPS